MTESRVTKWLVPVTIVVLCLPALVFRYLPMTDLPQHLAVASIIDHHDDPTFGFAGHYDVDWLRTPYVLTYALAILFGKLVELHAGMQIVVFLSQLAFPLGMLALVRAAGKPSWIALLAVPLVYNRTFFWGFVNFNLSIGLALAAFALYVSPIRSIRRDVLVTLACFATTFSHIYGQVMLAGLVTLYGVMGGYRHLRARWWTLLPIVIGVGLWAASSRTTHGYGGLINPPFSDRLLKFPHEVLGGYQDLSESSLLVGLFVAWVVLAWSRLPLSGARIKALGPIERVAWLASLGNLVLYFVLPHSTWTAKLINFRHAFLACALLPVLATASGAPQSMRIGRALAVALAIGTVGNSWAHLAMFDREARRFDRILVSLPPRPRVLSLMFEAGSDIMRRGTAPYLHFGAYVQAEKGGLLSFTFPARFWNLPVTYHGDEIPETPESFEWNMNLYSESFGRFYDYALVRIHGTRGVATSAAFPFELIAAVPPWQLYRRIVAPPGRAPTNSP
jgi:hypothetical protein